jgi:hypothetical protein
MIYITYYNLEMERQTISIMLDKMYHPKKKEGTYTGDFSEMTVLVKNPASVMDTSFISWDEMVDGDDLLPESNENEFYQGLPGSCYRNDIN